MSIQLKTHKMLWGRSGNICAFPDCKQVLVMDVYEADDLSVIGEEAHIVAKLENGPRGISTLSLEQRNTYENLILMCSIHHKIIDDHPELYGVDELLDFKRKHEYWVRESLSIDKLKQREDEIYAFYIDEINKLADIENFKEWTSWLVGGDHPKMHIEHYDNLTRLVDYINSRIWYNRYPELENAILNFNNVLSDLIIVFDEHTETIPNRKQIWTRKFYKTKNWDETLYKELLRKYMFHVKLIVDLALELTRAFNLIFDKVRKFLFPSYRIHEGVLLIEVGPFVDKPWSAQRVEYKPDEKTDLPYPGLRSFMKIRDLRDLSFGEGTSEDYFPIILV